MFAAAAEELALLGPLDAPYYTEATPHGAAHAAWLPCRFIARHSCLLTEKVQELALLGPLHAHSYTEATWGLSCCPGTSNRRLRCPAACLT